jgi:hypothetical protein
MPEATHRGDYSEEGEGEDILVEMDDDRHPMMVALSSSSRKIASSSNTAKVASSDDDEEEAPDDAVVVDPQPQSSRRFLLLRPIRNQSSLSSNPTTTFAKRFRNAPPTPSRGRSKTTELNRQQSQPQRYHCPQKPQLVRSGDEEDDDHHDNSAENLHTSKFNSRTKTRSVVVVPSQATDRNWRIHSIIATSVAATVAFTSMRRSVRQQWLWRH